MEDLGIKDKLSDFGTLTKEFEKVLSWLDKLGVNTKIGRIAAYKLYLEVLIDNPKNESIPPIKRANIQREIFELVWIYQNYLDEKSESLKKHVKKTLKGVMAVNIEKVKDHSPRNFLFELRVAAYFKKYGFDINLDTDCDLIATKNKDRFYIECKRLNSSDKIEKRIKEAERQLNKRFNSIDEKYNNYGLIWIDLSFILTNYSGFYSTHYRRTGQIAARYDLLNLTMNNLPRIKYNKRIIGLISQNIYPGISAIPKGRFTGSTVNIFPTTNNPLKRRKLRKTMKVLLENN